MKTKLIISTQTIRIAERSVVNRKVILRLDELVIKGQEGYLVKTTAFTEVPVEDAIVMPGVQTPGLKNRLQFFNYKENPYTNEQIDGLFSMIDSEIVVGAVPFSTRIREIMSEALLLSVVSENTFGFEAIEDWEFVTEELWNDVLIPVEPEVIPEPETPVE